jgi:Transmembrane domain of unknown function (DUF3566)
VSSPNEPDDTKVAGTGKDAAPTAPTSGSWVAEAAAAANRSAESGEAPPWQRAAARNTGVRPGEKAPRAGAAARPTEVIRAVESTEDASRAVVISRPVESAGKPVVNRVAEPAPRPDARTTVTPAVPPQPARPVAQSAPPQQVPQSAPPVAQPAPPQPVPQAVPPVAQPAPPVPQPAPPAHPVLDAKTSRYVTGTAAPRALQQMMTTESEPARTEVARPKDVGSELPDLSGTPARPVQRSEADAVPRSRIQVGARAKGGPVRASMQIRRVDPWSALKVSLLLSVALFFVWMIAVAFLYLVLGGMGVWTKLNSNVGDLLTSNSGAGGELVSAGSIFGGALLIGLVNIVLLTAMATLGAFIYNLATDIVGGVEVTLADRD